MTTYNPHFFGHSSPDFIPANPPAPRLTPDPNRRESVLQPQMTEAQWHAAKPRWSYGHSSGELESPYMMEEVDPREINRILNVALEKHDKVTAIVLWLTPECVNYQFHELRCHGFTRAEHRENSKIPQLAFEGPAVKWRT